MKTKAIVMALSFIATFGILSAQVKKTETSNPASKKTCYVDVNKNNVCDKSENKTCIVDVKRLRDSCVINTGNRQCLRDGSGRGKGKGKKSNFLDANKNGICDNKEVTK